MLAINIFGNKEYWKDIFWPNVPFYLKAPVPLMPFIELFGVFTKPFALMIRLFANMMAGHAMILSFTCGDSFLLLRDLPWMVYGCGIRYRTKSFQRNNVTVYELS